MTLKKYLDQVAKRFDAKKRKCDKEKHCLRVALKKLKHHKRDLQAKLEDAHGVKDRDEIKRELKVIHAQRRKGLKLLKELKKN